jgi:hypothetical protein
MKKVIRITESQLLSVVDSKKLLMELETSPAYVEHWENKFAKSVEVLLKLGHSPDELVKKIQNLAGGNEVGTEYSGNMEVSHNMKYDKEKPLLER